MVWSWVDSSMFLVQPFDMKFPGWGLNCHRFSMVGMVINVLFVTGVIYPKFSGR